MTIRSKFFYYKEEYIEESVNKKFHGLQIYNHLNWKNHIHQLIIS
jgi:hypothetical protein